MGFLKSQRAPKYDLDALLHSHSRLFLCVGLLCGRCCHLVQLELSAGFLAVRGILGNDALLRGLVETSDEFLELLLGFLTAAGVGCLEELLVRIVKLSLGDRIALVRLGVLTVTFPGGAAALDISHFLFPSLGMFAVYFTAFR